MAAVQDNETEAIEEAEHEQTGEQMFEEVQNQFDDEIHQIICSTVYSCSDSSIASVSLSCTAATLLVFDFVLLLFDFLFARLSSVASTATSTLALFGLLSASTTATIVAEATVSMSRVDFVVLHYK